MTILNGVNLDVLKNEVIARTKTEPELFRKTIRSRAVWQTGTAINIEAGKQVLNINCGCENPLARAKDPNRAFGPAEVVLGALGSCMGVAYVVFGALKGIAIHSLRIELEGDIDVAELYKMDDDRQFGFSNIRMDVFIETDATEEQLKEMNEMSKRKSPIYDLLANPKKIDMRFHSTANA